MKKLEPYTLRAPLEEKVKETGEVVASIKQVTFKPLKAGDLLSAMDTSGEKMGSLLRALMARSMALSHAQVDDLEMDDFAVCLERVEGFLPASLRTGAKPLS